MSSKQKTGHDVFHPLGGSGERMGEKRKGHRHHNNKAEEESVDNMSEYAVVQKGALKLKGVGVASAGKKKKKKDKEKRRLEQQVSQNEEETKKGYVDKRTPAQMAFDKTQEKRQMERILNKASKTHKHRVEDFNRHLDNLTEHYDIPKVSWTK